MAEGIAIRRHAIGGGNSAQGTDIFIRPCIPHHADRRDRQQYGKGLPDLIIKTGIADFFEVNTVGTPQHVTFFGRDLAGNADRQPLTGKRMPADDVLACPFHAPAPGLHP